MKSAVRIPRGGEPPFEVFINGVQQVEGKDYAIEGDRLVFSKYLQKEGKLGFWRWLSMALSIAGTYRRNDSIDVTYTLAGRRRVATGLDILPSDAD